MDTEKLIAHGRARFDHAAARRLLKEKYVAKMLFAYAGGMWQAGPDLLCTLSVCNTTNAVIPDLYEQPIRISVQELKELAYQRWQEQMTAWAVEYEMINTKR